MTEEQKFHASRVMFVLLGNDLRIAPTPTTMSHKEWFNSRPELNIDYNSVVRGYYRDGILCLYTGGDDFTAPKMCDEYIQLAKDFGASKIHLGAIKDVPGKPWKPYQIIDV